MKSDLFEERTGALLRQLREDGTYKELKALCSPMGPIVQLDGQGEVIVLCSNNYLGLANHPEVRAAAQQNLELYGVGTASVRFICGTFECHQQLEQALAAFSGTESALTYVSCWNANEAVIGTVTGPDDVLISDELNHASIIDGCRLARPAAKTIFKHNDMADLEAKLKEHAAAAVRWVISDGVFSMEGELANLPDLVEVCRKYDAKMILDDSHGVGVLGRTGRGTVEHFDMLGEVDVITGTLGKALGGAAGGYAAGSRNLIELLIQRSRPSLFSNALPPVVAGAAGKAVEILQRDTILIDRLRNNIATIRTGLKKLGFECQDSPTAIIPIHIGDEAEAIKKSQRLFELGVWVVAFGYPVVPLGKARLRVQVSAALTDEHIQKILEAFAKL